MAPLLDAVEQTAVGRIYRDIHFRSANEDGLQAGIIIGEWIATHYCSSRVIARVKEMSPEGSC
jgi:hypothetical protein